MRRLIAMDSDDTSAPPMTADAIAVRLRELGLDVEVAGDGGVPVVGMTHDSRSVASGQLFACLRGDAFDGHEFAAAAVESGAVALLVDHRRAEVPGTVAQLIVADTRIAAGPVATAAWGNPSSQLLTVGITGTNGKTTTAQIVAALLEGAGHSTGIIGTLHGPRTTPEAADLQAALRGFVDTGHSAAVMEVSSHALALHRVDGTAFDVVAFTNLGHDHLDLHGTHEMYFRAKSLLFSSGFAEVAVINVDDPHGRLLADTVLDRAGDEAMRVVAVSRDDITDLHVDSSRHSYTWRGRRVVVPLGGSFNVDNSLVALSLVAELDVDIDQAIAGLAALAPVPGRFETVESADAAARGIRVIVDYAHTPDGLETLLDAARPLTDGRIITVFGCAGRRDREKRPVMGAIAARLSDLAIATSDNPRGEDPAEIIDDVIAGVADEYRSRVTAEPDRRRAIDLAVSTAQRGDLVVIAGKGHEQTQDLGDVTIDFDDRTVALDALANSHNEDSL